MKRKIKRSGYIDQTALVNQLLYISTTEIISFKLHNSSRYKAITSQGIFEGTDVHYFAVLDQLQRKMDKAKRKTKRNQLLNDIWAIEDGYQGERKPLRWYTLPPQYADRMVAKGYMILQMGEVYWWGDDQRYRVRWSSCTKRIMQHCCQ